MYLDRSWTTATAPQSSNTLPFPFRSSSNAVANRLSPTAEPVQAPVKNEISSSPRYETMPDKRYIGSVGVTGWATRSGFNLIAYGEKVSIERQKTQSTPAKFGKRRIGLGRQDVIVRFTNKRNEEVGRLEGESAGWISSLIDQKICHFEGVCVFAPERLRTNDNVFLQLKCYLLKSVFEPSNFKKPEDNRETGLFEAKETQDERDLRFRQVAIVKLFDEINLQPTKINSTAQKHKKQGILQAAEMAEERDQQKQSTTQAHGDASSESEEGEELEQDQLDSLYKKAQSFDFDTPEAEAADTFVLSLRKYQRQALHWMLGKEKDQKIPHKEASMHPLWEEYRWPTKDADDRDLPEVADQPCFYVNPYSGEMSLEFPVQEQNCLGGILADEMGLGKTIEMLSLMHSHKADLTQLSDGQKVNSSPRQPNVIRAPCTTLVVAPMSLLAQWQSEAEKASKAGSLKVLVYYGSDKNIDLRTLCCAGNATNAPNLIITSYGTILSEFGQVAAHNGNRGMNGGLFSLQYFRVILDEAHYIKNRLSKTAKACYEISAEHRWVLTGTPIVNRLEDLFSLVHFLKVEPWSNFSFWKTFITVPFESKDFIRALDVVQTVLEPLVLRRTKDMKTPEGEALVPLPQKTVVVEKIQLSKQEREVYDYIFMRAKRTFNQNVEAGTLLKSYTTIFAQILRLRQSCCHPVLTRNASIVADEEVAATAADLANGLADDMDLQTLIEHFTAEDEDQDANKFGAHVLRQIQEQKDMECPVCSEEPMIDPAVTGCWHSSCKECLLKYIEHQREKGEIPRCFNCREPLNSRDIFEVVRHDPTDDELYSATPISTPPISLRRVGCNQSAKIEVLLSHLKRLRQGDALTKSVVFSQFTAFLDLIEPALTRDRIPYLRFDGSMAQKQRAAVLSEFASRPKGVVLLLSLRAGGVGLNLTCAKQVFMMDPWWSFAVEAQAIDRVHRMGQEEEVQVHRFIVEGSIEEKMLRIQDRKKFM